MRQRGLQEAAIDKLESEHPGYKKDGAYEQLHRSEQAAIFRLCT